MVFTVPVTSRRAVLASVLGSGAGSALSGCFGGHEPPPPPKPHPLAATLVGVQAMVDLYEATSATYAELSDRLGPLLADHRAHLDAVRRAMGTPSPTASPTASASATASVPPDPDAALVALKAAEKKGQADASAACLSAPAEYAALIGSIAACRATHVEVFG
jgi:hypothetical protein